MKTTIIALIVATTILTVHFACVPIAQALVIDQFSPVFGGGDFGLHSNYLAQTFTPGLDGTLDHITLTLEGSGGSGVYSLDIVLTNAGLPTTNVLATALVPAPIQSGGAFLTDFDFSASKPLLLLGTQYAWVLHNSSAGSANTYGANNPLDFYLGGSAFRSTDQGATYVPHVQVADFAFATFMEPIPEPTTSALALAALCLAMSRRRTR